MVGYLIEQELNKVLPSGRLFATLLTQILVDARDPAFRRSTKPIGPVYERTQAEALAKARTLFSVVYQPTEDGRGTAALLRLNRRNAVVS